MLGPDGQPLTRRYVCSRDDEPLSDDQIVRGYERDDGFVTVTDEELQALEPGKSRDIDLRRFVPVEQIDPCLLERPYLLAPAGDSTKAYHLLVAIMAEHGRAGIATFVMRGREYVIAVFARDGLLHGATLRFSDELRSADDVGLPAREEPSASAVKTAKRQLAALAADTLDEEALRDRESEALWALAERKLKQRKDVIDLGDTPEALAPEGSGDNILDLMAMLKRRLGQDAGDPPSTEKPSSARSNDRADLGDATRDELYERAKALDIAGRSKMTKAELAAAIADTP